MEYKISDVNRAVKENPNSILPLKTIKIDASKGAKYPIVWALVLCPASIIIKKYDEKANATAPTIAKR